MGVDYGRIAEQITDIYLQREFWHDSKLSREESIKYHEDRLRSGNIITVSDGEKLASYVEFYVNKGVCFVHNLFILPEYRRGRTIFMMYRQLKKVTKAKVYLGDRNKNGIKFPEVQLGGRQHRFQ